MKIRSTENKHDFQGKLFKQLHVYNLQGLLMDENGEFTAGVEAIQFEDGDACSVPFEEEELWAKYLLTETLDIPMYLVFYRNGSYYIVQVKKKELGKVDFESLTPDGMDEKGFAGWWGNLKGMPQTKQLLNGAGARADETVFDSALRKYGLEWGGNIDGFILSDDNRKVVCIVDTISVSRGGLSGVNSHPAYYFNSPNPKHGPRYEGWYGAVKLANRIPVPHMLLTIDKANPSLEHVGMTFIDDLSPSALKYVGNVGPNERVISGMDDIVEKYNELVRNVKPPTLVEKNR